MDNIVKLSNEEIENINEIELANQYLKDTDWYIIRKIERGIDVPLEISNKRLELINLLQVKNNL